MGFRKLLGLMTGLVGTRVAGALATLLTQIVLARILAADDMGVYFVVVALSSALGVVITGGYSALGFTYLARYRALGRESLFAGFLATARRDILRASAAVAVIALLVVVLVPAEEELHTSLPYGLAVAPAVAFMLLHGTVANSMRRFPLSFLPNFLLRPAALFVVVLAILALTGTLTLTEILLSYLLLAYAIAGLQAYLLDPRPAAMLRPAPPARKPRIAAIAPIWRRRAAALIIVTLFAVASADLVVLVAGLFLAPEDVAVVGVSIRLAVLVGFVTQACHQFVLPDLTQALASGSAGQVRPILLRANVVGLTVTSAAFLGALAVGDYALAVFGSEYVSGQGVLVALMASQILRAASGMNVHLLSLGAQQARTASACVVSIVALVLAAAVLAPVLGALGMALAVVLSDAIWALGSGLIAHRRLARRGDIFALIGSAPAAAK